MKEATILETISIWFWAYPCLCICLLASTLSLSLWDVSVGQEWARKWDTSSSRNMPFMLLYLLYSRWYRFNGTIISFSILIIQMEGPKMTSRERIDYIFKVHHSFQCSLQGLWWQVSGCFLIQSTDSFWNKNSLSCSALYLKSLIRVFSQKFSQHSSHHL